MITRPNSTKPMALFTAAEREALRTLRLRYQQDHDLFSTGERARLDFVRWLRQTGRIYFCVAESGREAKTSPMKSA